MTFLVLSSLSNCVAAYSMAVVTWLKCPNRSLARGFGFYLLLVGTWAFFHFLWRLADTPARAEPVFIFLMLNAVWINFFLLYFVLTFTRNHHKSGKFLVGLAVLHVVFSYFTLSGGFYSDFTPQYRGEYWPSVSPLFHVFHVFWQAELAGSCYLLYRYWEQSEGQERQQSAYLLVGHVIAYLGGNMNWTGFYGIQFFPELNILVTVYVFILTYAMVRHRILDIQIVLRKTLVYSLSTAVLTLLYAFVISLMMMISGNLMGKMTWGAALAVAVITAIVFQPVVSSIREWVDRRFPREALSQALLKEATGHFVHEVRRPLAHMTLPAQLARQDLETLRMVKGNSAEVLDRIDQRLRYIVDKSQEASALIQAVSDLTSERENRNDPLDLIALVREAVQDIQSRFEKEGISLLMELPEGQIPLTGHPEQLRIVLSNLLKNAIDALCDLPNDCQRKLSIKLRETGSGVVLEIMDTGKGIPSDALPHLFDPWFTTKGSKGMGIGLYLTKEILRRHGAKIEVQSGAENWTVFRISFAQVTL